MARQLGLYSNPIGEKVHEAKGTDILSLLDMLIQIGSDNEERHLVVLLVCGSVTEAILGRPFLASDHPMIRKINQGKGATATLQNIRSPPNKVVSFLNGCQIAVEALSVGRLEIHWETMQTLTLIEMRAHHVQEYHFPFFGYRKSMLHLFE